MDEKDISNSSSDEAVQPAASADGSDMAGESKVTRRPKREKPLVEGINTPASKNSPIVNSSATSPLTSAEQQLIEGKQASKGAPVRVNSKPVLLTATPPSKGHRILWWLLSLLIIAALGFGLYTWNKAVHVAVPVATNTTSTNTYNSNQTQDTTPVATSSPETSSTTPATTPVQTTPPPATTTSASVTKLQVTQTPTGFLNVRQQPSTTSQLVTKINPGETYEYIAQKSGWYEIVLSDGTNGWVSGQYIKIVK